MIADYQQIHDRVASAYQIARVLVFNEYPCGVPETARLTPDQQAALEHLQRAEDSLATFRRARFAHDLAAP